MRHRIVLHNSDLGVELTKRAFPERTDCEAIVLEHVRQDLGAIPSLLDWIGTAYRPISLPWRAPDDDEVVWKACKKIRLQDEAPVRAVLGVLTMASHYLPGQEDLARAILMNSFGPPLVRRILGPAYEVRQPGQAAVVFDPSWVAEGIVVANFGSILPLRDVLAAFPGRLADD